MRIAPAGDRALLVTLPDASATRVRAAADGVRTIAGVVAAIIGHESVYVIGTSDADAVQRAVDASVATSSSPAKLHRIPVLFDGLDLAEFLDIVHISHDVFLQRIPSIRLVARYLGFRAGWAYLDGWPPEWSMPRRSTSRNLVAGGSFAIAGSMAGFYPVDSPGGWNILGRTTAPVNVFTPGDEIVMDVVQTLMSAPAPTRVSVPHGEPIADVISPGQLTTIVAAPDWKRLDRGEAPGGPFDEDAAAAANAAVGNDPGAPLLECVLVGPKLRMRKKLRVAFCDGELNVRAFESEEVDVGRIRGMRGYLAIEGGVAGEVKKASPLIRPSGTFSPLSRGEGSRRDPSPREAGRGWPAGPGEGRKSIQIKLGPHDAPPLPEEWIVTPHMNRVGIRLQSVEKITATLPTEMLSCGAQFGTLQWHADGSLVALGPDHPVTGGYLQPATVISTERWKLAQLVPGDRIHLVAV